MLFLWGLMLLLSSEAIAPQYMLVAMVLLPMYCHTGMSCQRTQYMTANLQ